MSNPSKSINPKSFGSVALQYPIPKELLDLKYASEAYPELNLVIPDGELDEGNAPLLELSCELEKIPPRAFEKQAFSLIYLPQKNALKSIGEFAFFGCTKLKDFVIPEEVNYIGEGAFAYCKSLDHIELPRSLTTVMPYLFLGCESLDMLTLHKGVRIINASAFIGLGKLSVILYYGTEAEWNAIEWLGGRDIIADIPVCFADDSQGSELDESVARYLEIGDEISKEVFENDLPPYSEKLSSLYKEHGELSEKIKKLLSES